MKIVVCGANGYIERGPQVKELIGYAPVEATEAQFVRVLATTDAEQLAGSV